MRPSNAERQRLYRQRRDKNPEKRATYLHKRHETYIRDVQCCKRVLINEMSERTQRITRRYWKSKQQESREKKSMNNIIISPPISQSTPIADGINRQQQQAQRSSSKKRAKCYRDNKILQIQLSAIKIKMDSLRKKIAKSPKNSSMPTTCPDTPNSKARRQLNYPKKTLKKTLIFHNIMVNEIKKSSKKIRTNIAANKVIKKYQMFGFAKNAMKLLNSGKYNKKTSMSQRLRGQVQDFFQQDSISSMTSGVRNTITRKKVKKQKRLLNDTCRDVYKKFLEENKVKLSFTIFYRMKPFWVVARKNSDRKTCECKPCENTKFKAEALVKSKIIDNSSNLQALISQLTCSPDNKDCMYGQCDKCKNKKIPVSMTKIQKERQVTWPEWQTVREERILKRGEKKTVCITVKKDMSGTIDDLYDEFHRSAVAYKKHLFNLTNQQRYYKTLKNTLQQNEALIHVDFAENYLSKMHQEIQSMHFGASKSQITLHTGYFQTSKSNNVQSFCTLSDSLQHDPPAIWAHLTPVLKEIRTNHPEFEVSSLHVYSDSPATQYRQKTTFFFCQHNLTNLGFNRLHGIFMKQVMVKGSLMP